MPVLQGPAGAESCFRCPKRRIPGEAGWYFVHFEDAGRIPGPNRLYVCPKDYLGFAASERARWAPVATATHHHDTNGDHDHPANGSGAPSEPCRLPDELAPSQHGTACSADELITLLTRRGLAGWAFLVRDVAAGRVRRVYLRQLPVEPEIRGALVTYLHSTGTAVATNRVFLNHQHQPR